MATRGTQAKLAKELGVSPSTVSRQKAAGKLDPNKLGSTSNDLANQKQAEQIMARHGGQK